MSSGVLSAPVHGLDRDEVCDVAKLALELGAEGVLDASADTTQAE
jgi:predicted kinase